MTAPPRKMISMLSVAAGGGAENTSWPLMTAYESVFCLTPEMNTSTEASLPYSYSRLNVVVVASPEKNWERIVPPIGEVPI